MVVVIGVVVDGGDTGGWWWCVNILFCLLFSIFCYLYFCMFLLQVHFECVALEKDKQFVRSLFQKLLD